MPYISLYRKYRPQTFADILGQAHVSATLANAITEDRVAHAYLFTGPRGTGKTSTARILAKALNCEKGPTPSPCGVCNSCVAITEGSSLDVIEMDAASHSKVDETRDILAGVPLASAGSNKKVYVIDEVHMLTTQSFNALLKTLEEPPPHVVFILATTEAHKVLPTIVSRTQRFDFRRVPSDVLQGHLEQVAKLEGIDMEPQALAVVTRHADGSVRDALSVLDQLSSVGGRIGGEDVEKLLGGRREDVLVVVFDAVAAGDVGAIFRAVGGLVAQGADMRQLAFSALEHARSLLLVKTAPEAETLLDLTEQDRASLVVQAGSFSRADLLRALDLLTKAITEMRNAPAHRLLLEIALVRAAVPATDPSATGLLGRIERLERRIGIDAGRPEEAPADGIASVGSAPPAARQERRAAVKPAVAGEPVNPPPATAAPVQAPSPGSHEGTSWQGDASAPAANARRDEQADVAVGLNHLKDAWPATLKEISKTSKKVWGLLSPSRPVRLEDDALVIEVQSPWHRDTLQEGAYSEVLSDALFAVLGTRPKLLFEVRGAEGAGDARAAAATSDVVETRPEPLSYAEAAPAAGEDDPIELVKKGLAAEVVEEKEG